MSAFLNSQSSKMGRWWQGVARGALPLPTGGAYLATPHCLPAAESPALTLDFTPAFNSCTIHKFCLVFVLFNPYIIAGCLFCMHLLIYLLIFVYTVTNGLISKFLEPSLSNLTMTRGTLEVRSDKSLTLLTFNI